MEMTPPSGQDQADHPIKIQHPGNIYMQVDSNF